MRRIALGRLNCMPLTARAVVLALVVLAVALPGTAAMAQDSQRDASEDERPTFKPRSPETVPGEVIVKFEETTSPSAMAQVRRAEGLEKKKNLALIGAELVEVKGKSVEAAIRGLERRPDVEYVTPNSKRYPAGYADEPRFGELWGLHNIGQTVDGVVGTPDVDVNGREAATVTQGNTNLVVAVIDDGVDFSHPDLAGRQWVNPGESGNGKETNGVDDDGNGYVDDVNGWDFCHRDNTVHDDRDDYHGTHVSGTIAASVNGKGIVGVAPNVKIMALKFLSDDAAGSGCNSVAGAIEAIGYAKKMGAKISNNSWGAYGPPDPAEKAAIDASGQLFVAAAGNSATNNDTLNPSEYPASYTSPNIVSVAAINNKGSLAGFSAYGAKSVDISAPGVGILSSVPAIAATPSMSAAALSSVGTSGGKALTAGFGADEIGDATKRASFFTRAFQAVERESQQVVLVDDDQSDRGGTPDIGARLSSAIQSATGSAPQEIDVPYNADGPALSQLRGKTVVWATGGAWDSGAGTTLTAADQATLTDFLNGGGRLVITGMDALHEIEGSAFVTNTLGLQVTSDKDSTIFSGASDTAFAGEAYTFDSNTAWPAYHDWVVPAGTAALTQGSYEPTPAIPATWESWDGTSMATPHVAGSAALLASKYPGLLSNPTELKQVIMDHGKPLSATIGKTLTGKMVDANAVVTAVNEVNDPPVNSVPGAQTINEDSALIFSGADARQISVSDPDVGSSSVRVRLQADHGTLTLSGTRGLTFATGDSGTNDADTTFIGSLADVNAALEALRFDPEANYNGSAALTIITDDQGSSGTGGAKTDTDTVSIGVNAVNDAPSFTKGADQSVQESAGAQVIPNWATAISAGPANESGQTVSFVVTSDNTALFSGQPAVSSSGTLTYTPAQNAFGTANVDVVALDSGGTANGGDNTSDAQSFTITVNGENDPPTISNITDRTVEKDALASAVDFTVDDVDNAEDTLTLTGSSSDTTVVPNGNIVFGGSGANRTVTVMPIKAGTTTITVNVSDGATQANDTFVLTVKDTAAPTVGVTTTVKRSGNAMVQFSEPMDPSTLMQNPNAQPSTSRTILLLKGGSASTTQVPAKVSCTDSTCQTVILNADVRLGAYKRYTVKVEGVTDSEAVGDSLAVEDLAGNKLARDYVKAFRTGAS